MNIGNLVKSAVFALATVGSACGDTNFNNYGSEGTAKGDSDSSNPAERICEEFLSCCAQVQDDTAQAVCYLKAGGEVPSDMEDCLARFTSKISPAAVACVAKSFYCEPTEAGYYSLGTHDCGGDLAKVIDIDSN